MYRHKVNRNFQSPSFGSISAIVPCIRRTHTYIHTYIHRDMKELFSGPGSFNFVYVCVCVGVCGFHWLHLTRKVVLFFVVVVDISAAGTVSCMCSDEKG